MHIILHNTASAHDPHELQYADSIYMKHTAWRLGCYLGTYFVICHSNKCHGPCTSSYTKTAGWNISWGTSVRSRRDTHAYGEQTENNCRFSWHPLMLQAYSCSSQNTSDGVGMSWMPQQLLLRNVLHPKMPSAYGMSAHLLHADSLGQFKTPKTALSSAAGSGPIGIAVALPAKAIIILGLPWRWSSLTQAFALLKESVLVISNTMIAAAAPLQAKTRQSAAEHAEGTSTGLQCRSHL